MDLSKLKEPFPASDIEWRVGSTTKDKSRGMALAFITNRAIQDRLDEVCGPENWKNEFREWHGTSQLCGISIKIGDEWITKWDGADNTDFESTKGGLSDSMKRAGYQWGIGRYLYRLPGQWMPIKPAGSSYRLAETPSLPDWALPDGSDKPLVACSEDQIKAIIDEATRLCDDDEKRADRLEALAIEYSTGRASNIEDLSKREASNLLGYLKSK
jgi:hypothetical protein